MNPKRATFKMTLTVYKTYFLACLSCNFEINLCILLIYRKCYANKLLPSTFVKRCENYRCKTIDKKDLPHRPRIHQIHFGYQPQRSRCILSYESPIVQLHSYQQQEHPRSLCQWCRASTKHVKLLLKC